MKLVTRIVFGLNFIYQAIVGIWALFMPDQVVAFYGAQPADINHFLMAAFRALGIYIFFGGVISLYIAANPVRRPILLRLMGILAALTLVCWTIVGIKGELPWNTMMLDIIVQAIIILTVILYSARPAAAAAPQATV